VEGLTATGAGLLLAPFSLARLKITGRRHVW